MSERKKPLLALTMMVKNEHLRIHVTLKSVFEPKIVDCVIMFDTGSTDNTIEIITDLCKQHNVPLFLKQGSFINFSVSRNELLDFAEGKSEYLLLMDCNDEVQNGQALINFCQEHLSNTEEEAFMMKQRWWAGGSLTDYDNIRLLRNDCMWRYFGVVHEYVAKTTREQADAMYEKAVKKLVVTRDKKKKSHYEGDIKNVFARLTVPETVIYQDRTKDDDKSFKRFARDAELLLAAMEEDRNDARSCFYLAQTYKCLGFIDKSIKWYQRRWNMNFGFWEERYNALYEIGKCREHLYFEAFHKKHTELLHIEWEKARKEAGGQLSKNQKKKAEEGINDTVRNLLNTDQRLNDLWKEAEEAYMFCFNTFTRAEPLVRIGEHYQRISYVKQGQAYDKVPFIRAYMYLQGAVAVPFPEHCKLFVDNYVYNYQRWHLLGIVCWYVDAYHEGERACKEALKFNPNSDVDKNNLTVYQRAIGERATSERAIGERATSERAIGERATSEKATSYEESKLPEGITKVELPKPELSKPELSKPELSKLTSYGPARSSMMSFVR